MRGQGILSSMSRSLMLIVLGALTLLAPFSGLPMSILTWILPLFGLGVVAVGVSYRRQPARVSHEASLSTSS